MDIREFYDKHSSREWLREPFNIGNRTIATTGYALLSLPRNDQYDVLTGNKADKVEELLKNIESGDFNPVPLLEIPEQIDCDCCMGTGKASKEYCKECDGEGEVELETDFNTYTCECKTCYGEGIKVIPGGNEHCPECKGRKKVFDSPVKVYDMYVNATLLHLILNEPDLQIATREDKGMLLFKAGDAEGVIMGMRANRR